MVSDRSNTTYGERRLKLLERVLKQAVLTQGGSLRIDPKFSQQAKDETRLLEIGGKKVTLLDLNETCKGQPT